MENKKIKRSVENGYLKIEEFWKTQDSHPEKYEIGRVLQVLLSDLRNDFKVDTLDKIWFDLKLCCNKQYDLLDGIHEYCKNNNISWIKTG